MRGLLTFAAATIAILPSFVWSGPLPLPQAAVGISLDSRTPEYGVIDIDSDLEKRGLVSSDLSTGSTTASSAAALPVDIPNQLKVLVSIFISLSSGSVQLPSDPSFQGLFDAANQLVGATNGGAVVDALEAIEKQVNTLLRGVLTGDLRSRLLAISSQVNSIKALLPFQLSSLTAALNQAVGGTVGGLLSGLGLTVPPITLPPLPSITLPSIGLPSISVGVSGVVSVGIPIPSIGVPSITIPTISVPSVTLPGVTLPSVTLPGVTLPSVALPSVTLPSVAVPSITLPSISVPSVVIPSIPLPSVSSTATTTLSIVLDIQSIVSKLLALANGSIPVPSGLSIQGLLSAANQLVSATSVASVADSLVSLSAAINDLISSSTAVSDDLLTQLRALSLVVDKVKANLVGPAIVELDSALAASGGTVKGLLSSLGFTLDLSLLTQGGVVVGTPITGNTTVDLTAELQLAINTLTTIANIANSVTIPATVSVRNLLSAASQLVAATSATAVTDAVSSLVTETNQLLSSGVITGDLLTQLQTLSRTLDTIKNNLVGQAVTNLNTSIDAAGGTVAAVLSSLGTDIPSILAILTASITVASRNTAKSVVSTVNGVLS